MTRNPVSAALDLVDDEPSSEFLGALRTQLLADLREPGTSRIDSLPVDPQEPIEECIVIESNQSAGPNRRVLKIVLAAAACVAVVATAAVIVNRRNADVSELSDVTPQEAMPLAQEALIKPDALGTFWRSGVPIADSVIAAQAVATTAAQPQCAVLTSVGLFPPTAKSVAARQFLTPGEREEHSQTVFVFATPEDASRAMDVIEGKIFPGCWFNLFDRLTPRGGFSDERSISTAWEAPAIAPRGDRQVIVGQHAAYTLTGGSVEVNVVNVYVQVGRAISWINPAYGVGQEDRLFSVNKALDATTAALEAVFGG
jgi:hypothetical protein